MTLAAALILDAIFGEPRWLWSRVPHPVVLMGRLVDVGDRLLNRGAWRRVKGALWVVVLAAAALGLGFAIAALPYGPVWETIGAAILLAHRSLVDHVRAVADGLAQGLAEGRTAVARIVGRDTREMDESAVARAAIESAGENFSDGVVAPALWFAALGLPGIFLYKIVNTADSMIGHKTEKHLEFGWAAARLDDVLNWAPARFTAVLIAAAHRDRTAWRIIRRDAPLHRSPNAGWPEAALACALDAAVSGPRSYGGRIEDHPFVNREGRHDLSHEDVYEAYAALWRVWGEFLIVVTIVGLVRLIAF
ncbi:MAG: adenosylcobinamide-phosphate synthase CbiB [Pseudomonadota bacterium]